MNAHVSIWTEQVTQSLQALYANHSASQIAAKLNEQFGLGLTKSAVIGKLTRLGITSGPAKRAEYEHAVRQANRKAAPVPRKEEAAVCQVEPLNLTIAEIGPGQCRYIAGDDFLFCAHPVQEGSSYCSTHHRLCWRAPEKRWR